MDLQDEAAWKEAVNGGALERMVLSSADPSDHTSPKGLGGNRVRRGGSGSLVLPPREEGVLGQPGTGREGRIDVGTTFLDR